MHKKPAHSQKDITRAAAHHARQLQQEESIELIILATDYEIEKELSVAKNDGSQSSQNSTPPDEPSLSSDL